MTDHTDRDAYYVRATAPKTDEQVTYKCAGMAGAQAKTAELRMSGHRDVVMSTSDPSGGLAAEVPAPLMVE